MYIDRGIEVMSQSARVQHSSSGTKLRKVCSAMRFLGFWVVHLPLEGVVTLWTYYTPQASFQKTSLVRVQLLGLEHGRPLGFDRS